MKIICFNPRTREGCDPQPWQSPYPHHPFQSTHPRGVRPASCWAWTPTSSSFNPRTREGCDHVLSSIFAPYEQFQSTHPRGVRHTAEAPPPARTGVSIHAPARGATSTPTVFSTSPTLFQSTHPRGVRLSCGVRAKPQIRFQSTHPRGVRLQPARLKPQTQQFQSTHPRGVRLLSVWLTTMS